MDRGDEVVAFALGPERASKRLVEGDLAERRSPEYPAALARSRSGAGAVADLVREPLLGSRRNVGPTRPPRAPTGPPGPKMPGRRRPSAHRRGYRARARDTRAGTVSLKIPELRKGTYQPPFLEPHRRSERALHTKAGMHVHHRDDIHELELRPGREIVTIG